ncbi:MAG: hypothetical protein LBK65_07180 [Tannerellaceae bacterium]|jgi:hypothetical protein|nr:hypothetical protein [Tannerellaceae bacterium]
MSTLSNLNEALLAAVRRWHGSIEDQFSNIDNIVKQFDAHPSWPVPMYISGQLASDYDQLDVLVKKCRTISASQFERQQRNTLLKSTVGLCLDQIRLWAYGERPSGAMTDDDIHSLGFLLPGENGGRHERVEATDVVPEVKVTIVSADFIRVVIDQAAGENAAQVVHGWPTGVSIARIVITSSDGKTVVYDKMTSHLHNDIRMPEGSHGKQFMIKASFLRHVDDESRFGAEPTFSMPLATEDLVAALDRQHYEEFEARIRAVESHRQEIENLQAAPPSAE